MKKLLAILFCFAAIESEAQWKGVTGTSQKNTVTGEFRFNYGSDGIVSISPSTNVDPLVLNYDWDASPLKHIDMTIDQRSKYGPNPHVEVWLKDVNKEFVLPSTFEIKKIKPPVFSHQLIWT